MNLKTFADNFQILADTPNGIPKLREMILQLAVMGKLVPQDPKDKPASVLLEKIAKEKERLVAEAKIKKQKPLTPIKLDEAPYELPEAWEWVKFEELSKKITDGEHISPEKTNSGTMLLTAKHVTQNGISLEDPQFVTNEDAEKFRQRCDPEQGDIVICSRGTIGRCAVVNVDVRFCLMGSVILIKPFTLVDSQFLVFFLQTNSAQDWMKGSTGATAVKALYLKDIRKCPIPLAPRSEQRRIVAKANELLALCDRLEEQKKRREELHTNMNSTCPYALISPKPIESKKGWTRIRNNFDLLYDTPESVAELRQSILQLAVMGKLVPQDPKDEPAHILLKRIAEERARLVREGKIKKQKRLQENRTDQKPFKLPKGWTWARFPELGEFRRGKSKHRPRNDPSLYSHGKYPMVQTGDVARANGVVKTYTALYNEKGLSQSGLWPKGTMCITIAANIADSGILGFDACFPDSIVGFIPSAAIGDARYFEYFMRTAKERLVDFAPSTAQKNINLGILETVNIPLPPVQEIKRIVIRLDELMTICDILRSHLNYAQTIQVQLADAIVEQAVA